MSNGFLGRLARKWWLMLMVGIIVGLGVSIPLQGVLPDSLFGYTFGIEKPPIDLLPN